MKRIFFLTTALIVTLFINLTPLYAYQSGPIMVTNTADSGTGSLRAAITAANAANGNSVIQFNIPRTDAGFNGTIFRIRVATALPALTKDGTIIDGSTQTVATGDTNPFGPEIVIDGSAATSGADGLVINSTGNVVRALVISNFINGNGLRLGSNSRGNSVTNCFIGTEETGRAAAGNRTGIRIEGGSNSNIIGGATISANVISGNLGDGITITGLGSDNNTVTGNIIGLDSTQSGAALPNLGDGIEISGSAKANVIGSIGIGNTISSNMGNGILITGLDTLGNRVTGNAIGTSGLNLARGNGRNGILISDGANNNTIGDIGAGNIIAFNGGDGVAVGVGAAAVTTVRNRISRNSIFSNNGLGIDLGDNGVSNNDSGDGDLGPNNLLNFPVLTNVNVVGTAFTLTGTLDTLSPNTMTVEIYTNGMPTPGGDPSGFGEGQTFITSVIPNAMGTFSANFSAAPNALITMIAIDSNGNTSEFSSFRVGVGGNTPDLVLRSLRVTPASVNPGEQIRVEFVITNSGSANAPANMLEVRASSDNVIGADDLLLDSRTVDVINAGAVAQFGFDLRLPATIRPGQLFIGVACDTRNSVMESNETNNSATTSINVTGNIDLNFGQFTLTPTTVTPGAPVMLSATLINRGTLPAPAALIEARLSNDQQITPSDPLLGTFTSPVIAAGQTVNINFPVTIPATTAAGNAFIGITVDPNNQIMEANETNNTLATGFAVADVAAPIVTLMTPNGNEPIPAGSTVVITWTATDNTGITSQDILLSTDGGATFTQMIASGLGGDARSFTWMVPAINTEMARVRVVSRDAAGNSGNDASDMSFVIAMRPLIISPVLSKNKLTLVAPGANILPGAQLVVINGNSRESFVLVMNSSGTKLLVDKRSVSTPSALGLKDVIVNGVTVMLVVKNPNGIESLPAAFQRR